MMLTPTVRYDWSWMSFALSTENVENVVKAPRNPVVKPVLSQDGYAVTKNSEVAKPSKKEPKILTVAVPMGIPIRSGRNEQKYRAMAPIAPNRAMEARVGKRSVFITVWHLQFAIQQHEVGV